MFVLSSFLQSYSGQYVLLVKGPSPRPVAAAMQFFGLAVSLLSLTKGCAAWMLFNSYNIAKHFGKPKKHIPINWMSLAKSTSFFLPHAVFRICGMSFAAAFLGYWSLIGAMINILVHIFFALENDGAFINLPMTILSPTIFMVDDKESRTFLKQSILTSAILLLVSLITIRLLPILSFLPLLPYLPMAPSIIHLLKLLDSRDLLHCTEGLHHLNFNTTASNYTYPPCSPFFQLADTTLNKTFSGKHLCPYLKLSLSRTGRKPGDVCDF